MDRMASIPFDVKTTFHRSDALDAHIADRLDAALRAHGRYIRRVEVRLTDVNGPRRGAHDKVAVIGVAVKPSGTLVAKGSASDLYASVTQAASRAGRALARHATRLGERGRRDGRRRAASGDRRARVEVA
jgi:ribosome-associated translation inhibitor RaiA